MYIRKIRIENIRGFGEGEQGASLDLKRPDGSLAGWTVLVGRNGAGKTTLLRAVALAAIGPATSAMLHGSFVGWVRKGAQDAMVRVWIEHDEGDRFEGDVEPPAPSFYAELEWKRQASGPEPKLTARPKQPPPKAKRNAALVLGLWSENPRGWFVAGYGSFRRLSGHASDAQKLMSAAPRIARLVSLFREDSSLVEAVQWFREAYIREVTASLDKGADKIDVQAELSDTIARLLNDGLLPEGAEIKRRGDSLVVHQQALELGLEQLSDGYRTVIALVLDIASQLYRAFGEFKLEKLSNHVRVPYSGVVLIDEIDVHLHIEWQKRIGFWFKKHFPRIQFIVTTHSPYICQAADPHGIIRLPAPGDNKPASLVSEDVYDIVVNGSADDAVITELFGNELPYSAAAGALRDEITDLESRLIEGRVTPGEKAKLKYLSAKLPKTPSAEVERALFKLTAQLGATPRAKKER